MNYTPIDYDDLYCYDCGELGEDCICEDEDEDDLGYLDERYFIEAANNREREAYRRAAPLDNGN
jgi:hypothetical protein